METCSSTPNVRRRRAASAATLLTLCSSGLIVVFAGGAQASVLPQTAATTKVPASGVAETVVVVPKSAVSKAAVSKAVTPKAVTSKAVTSKAVTSKAATPKVAVVKLAEPKVAVAKVAAPLNVAAPNVVVAPGSVPIGKAGQYGVLAGSGTTNTGVTTIRGDVGSSPTTTETGFAPCPGATCVTMVGASQNHNTVPDPNDTTTQTAKADLTAAYNYTSGLSSTNIPTELANQLLVAGVYSSSSGTFEMTGTLTLDGQNKPGGGVFIFQTGSTLVVHGAGRVLLINGADACNVFYRVGSAATLEAGSTLQGTVLAHDSISLGSDVTVIGRLLAGEQASGAGAVTLNHDTIVSSQCAAGVSSPPGSTSTGTPDTGTTSTRSGSPRRPGTGTTTGTSSFGTPSFGTTPTSKRAITVSFLDETPAPKSTGPQVKQVPVGGVHAGDGSTSYRRDAAPGSDSLAIAALVLAVAGGTLLAGSGGASALASRRRRQDS